MNTGNYKKPTIPLKVSEKKFPNITGLVVSNCGTYFATMDDDCCVSLFKKDHYKGDVTKPIEW